MRYTYDTRDNLRSVTDPDNLVTSYTYDGLGNLTGLSSPDTGGSSYIYDDAGNRKTQTDARNISTTYTYDALNRLIGITYPTSSLDITYTYDVPAGGCYNAGRLTKMVNLTDATTYCYDRRGNILSKSSVIAGHTFTTVYGYTLADSLISITYPSGLIVNYGRDTTGRIFSVNYQTSAAASPITLLSNITYYPFGPNKVFTFGNGRTLTKAYHSDYNIGYVASSAPNGLQIFATPDALGNLLNASSSPGASPPTASYKYDNLYRLIETDLAGTVGETYTYNKTGDRLSKTPQGQATQGYTYYSGTHRLASVAGATRTYDANGNTLTIPNSIGGGAANYSYDDSNRMSSTQGYCCQGGNTFYFYYNGKGEKVLTPQGVDAGFTSYDESGHLLGGYTLSGGRSDDYIYVDGTLVAFFVWGANTLYYTETDQLGTPRKQIQPGATTSSDTTIWSWNYFDANTTFGGNVVPTHEHPSFPGQYFSYEMGLYYNYSRDYEPGTGRYVESDPVGLYGGLNTYAYVSSRPLRSRDAVGLLQFEDSNSKHNQAANKVEQLLASNCGNCSGGSCFPCELKPELQRKFLESDVRSTMSNYAMAKGGLTQRCAFSHAGGSTISMAFNQSGFQDKFCQCEATILFHELLHEVGLEHPGDPRDPNDPVNSIEEKCDLCVKGQNFPWLSDGF